MQKTGGCDTSYSIGRFVVIVATLGISDPQDFVGTACLRFESSPDLRKNKQGVGVKEVNESREKAWPVTCYFPSYQHSYSAMDDESAEIELVNILDERYR